MHIPLAETKNLKFLSFNDTLIEEESYNHNYDRNQWLYLPCHYSEYRYILGTKGNNPLVCIGINPSTAAPDDLDNTLKSVERIAKFNGYDSFIMFNVYPQRATNPNDMDKELNEPLHRENIKAFEYILSRYGKQHKPAIWAAWGTIIEKRPYLRTCVLDMIHCGEKYGAKWYTVGTRSKAKGHPHHPLYLKSESVINSFDDILEYLEKLQLN